MNRPGHDHVDFFVGQEVEHTPAHSMTTLFVVGIQSIETIQHHLDCKIQHIFFGANHSFDPQTPGEYQEWQDMIMYFLDHGYLCTLDIPINQVHDFNDGCLCEHNNFIPQIRVSIPYIRLWNYNTMIKLDDHDFDATNPGVWCHSLHKLMTRDTFTSWREYQKDQPK